MKVPAGRRSQAAIRADIEQWVKDSATASRTAAVDLGSVVYRCRTCGNPIQQTTLYASIHDVGFGSVCAGSGEVVNLPLPYCPTCEPEVATKIQRTCIHDA